MKRPILPSIRVWSDLHLEFPQLFKMRGHPPAPAPDDVVVLAGDIGVGTGGVLWALQTFPENTVAYVLGNHEAYGSDLDRTIDACRSAAAGTNIRVLEKDVWEAVPGVRLIGATLWTNYELWGADGIDEAYGEAHRLADHRLITTAGRTFAPADARRRHLDTRAWLEAELARAHDDGATAIVITHHAPHAKCLEKDFRRARDPFSAAFASDLSAILEGPTAPKIWVSGHTHRNFRGRVGRTRLVSNQGSYSFRGEGAGFVPEGLPLGSGAL